MRSTLVLAVAALAAGSFGPAAAMAVRGEAAPSAKTTASAVPAAGQGAAAKDALTLIEGQVTAVDPARRILSIGGREVEWHATRTQVYRAQGGRVGVDAVQPGARLRFALEPGSGEGRKIVLIYLQAPR